LPAGGDDAGTRSVHNKCIRGIRECKKKLAVLSQNSLVVEEALVTNYNFPIFGKTPPLPKQFVKSSLCEEITLFLYGSVLLLLPSHLTPPLFSLVWVSFFLLGEC
jgi:hypothetical protein